MAASGDDCQRSIRRGASLSPRVGTSANGSGSEIRHFPGEPLDSTLGSGIRKTHRALVPSPDEMNKLAAPALMVARCVR